MKRTPCESMMWTGLPAIRKEFALCMVNEFGLSQKEVAQQLELSPAAICQYVSKKRGNLIDIDKKLLEEIKKSVELIINDDKNLISETCRICKFMQILVSEDEID